MTTTETTFGTLARQELIKHVLPYSTDGLIQAELKAFMRDVIRVTDDEQQVAMLEEQERNTAYLNGGAP